MLQHLTGATGRKLTRRVAVCSAIAVGIIAFAGAAVWSCLWLALPRIDGASVASGVHAQVALERDSYGVVSIHAADREDAVWALGYAHAQDRFFQMDMMRRSVAGELAELFGPAELALDMERRSWRMRALARRQLEGATAEERRLVAAYCRGVNAGLQSLTLRPPEYLLLGKAPRPWSEEDTFLVVHAMFFTLTQVQPFRTELLAALRHRLRPQAYAFLTWNTGEWDSEPLAKQSRLAAPPIPTPSANLGASAWPTLRLPFAKSDAVVAGSNAWSVSGALTKDHRALVAVDMHLWLGIPNIWYRAELHYGVSDAHSVYGVTLPGYPGTIVGSNGSIGWGLSNSRGEWTEILKLQPCRSDAVDGYVVDDHCVRYENVEERIKVAGEADHILQFRTSIFGKVDDGNVESGPRVIRWLGASEPATNLHYLDLAVARTVEDALDIAARSGIPPVNFVVADREGRIGWTIAGRLPVRSVACEAEPRIAVHTDMVSPTWLAPELYPRLTGDDQDPIVTANQRIITDDRVICDGGFQLGARALQISKRILATQPVDERALWQIQLDDTAMFLERWQRLLVALVGKATRADPSKYGALLERLRNWGGHAAVDSVGYRFVREFHDAVSTSVLGWLGREAGLSSDQLQPVLPQNEYPVWRLVSERPANWLPDGFSDWDAFLLDTVDRLLRDDQAQDPMLTKTTWGARNRLEMEHPLFGSVPVLSWIYRVAPVALPGDNDMPRVQSPRYGASERLVVSPGEEARGLLSMPGGQSGNPASPFFRSGHENWLTGRAQPLMARPASHVLILRPDDRS